MSKFPERLKELRLDNRINQSKLAKYFNYGSSAIANYETGRNEPCFDVLIMIADYFNVSIDYLLGRADQQITKETIKPEEEELLKCFRKLDNETKKDIINIVKKLTDNKRRI